MKNFLFYFLLAMLLWLGLTLMTISIVAALRVAFPSEPPPDEGELIEAMKDLRESMDKLNEELRDFENIKEGTIGKLRGSNADHSK